MTYNKSEQRILELDDERGEDAWKYAVGTFGIGDILTTAVGMSMSNVNEAHPISQAVLGEAGNLGMVAVKAGFLGLSYLAYKKAPEEYRIGIPTGLGILGSYIVVNNLNVLMRAR